MRKNVTKLLVLLTVTVFLNVSVLEFDAFARAGGGKSSGSRGSRSYSTPSRPQQPGQSREQAAPAPARPTPPAQQPAGGGFLRSLGGGILGGLIGGMLFRSLGFGGVGGGFGGSGVGLFEIILIAGIGFLIYRMVKRKKEENLLYQSPSSQGSNRGGDMSFSGSSGSGVGTLSPVEPASGNIDEGISHLRQMDPSFDEARFKDTAMDIFFKIQGAWMNRNLSPVGNLLTDEMRGVLQNDVEQLIREKHINRLENIAVRNIDITEVWQESGQDFVTTLIYANLLDYTTNEATGEVVAGSRTDPVKFEEYWTFTRPVGNNTWRLSGINQG